MLEDFEVSSDPLSEDLFGMNEAEELIRELRENEPEYFEYIKNLPDGIRAAKSSNTFIVGIFSESEPFLDIIYPSSDLSLIGMPMRIKKTKVFDFLMSCQIEKGGYTGNDIAKMAKNIPASQRALRKRIETRHKSF